MACRGVGCGGSARAALRRRDGEVGHRDGARLPTPRLMGAGFVLQKRAEGSGPALQHPEEPPGPDQGAGGRGPSAPGCPSPWQPWALPSGGRGGDPGARAVGPPCDGQWDPPVLAAVTCPPPSPQTHPSAWPFMEPVKKSEAPDYYEIIRFPIGGWSCPDPQDRVTEGRGEDPHPGVCAGEPWSG